MAIDECSTNKANIVVANIIADIIMSLNKHIRILDSDGFLLPGIILDVWIKKTSDKWARNNNDRNTGEWVTIVSK